jgi:hypothetical protein
MDISRKVESTVGRLDAFIWSKEWVSRTPFNIRSSFNDRAGTRGIISSQSNENMGGSLCIRLLKVFSKLLWNEVILKHLEFSFEKRMHNNKATHVDEYSDDETAGDLKSYNET